MKSDHRHELKTNELAEWLGNLPEWTKENLSTIIITIVVILAAVAIYSWRLYSKNVVLAGQQTELTDLVSQISSSKVQIVQAQQSQGRDLSFIILQPANNLDNFAQKTSHKQMSALALIKRAEALRAELHYGNPDEQYLTTQLNLAQSCYADALEQSSKNPALAAAAKFGLGLCAEELGNFEQARQTYKEIVEDADFESTLAAVQAKLRLETMADYEKKIVFMPAPKPPEPTTATGSDEVPDILPPLNIFRPLQFDMLPESVEPEKADLPVDANVSG